MVFHCFMMHDKGLIPPKAARATRDMMHISRVCLSTPCTAYWAHARDVENASSKRRLHAPEIPVGYQYKSSMVIGRPNEKKCEP